MNNPPQKKNSLAKTQIAFAAFIVASLVLVVAAAFLLYPVISNWGSEEKKSIQSTTLNAGFDSIAELSLEEYNFTQVVKKEESISTPFGFDLPFTDKRILLTYDGVVKAGIKDFEAIEVDVNHDSKVITIHSPRVEIIETYIDNSSVIVYDQSMNPFNQITAEDVTTLLAGEEEKAKQKAIELGLIDRAQERAEKLLRSHFESISKGYLEEDYEIRFRWEH